MSDTQMGTQIGLLYLLYLFAILYVVYYTLPIFQKRKGHRMRKTKLLTAGVLLLFFSLTGVLLLFFSFSRIQAASITQVSSVIIPDTNGQEFSLTMNLSTPTTLKDWAFGFYMPRTFYQLNAVNPTLTLQICSNTTQQCQPLTLVTKKNSNSRDYYSAGYTSLLAPKDHTDLSPGNYTIQLKNNNQWAPGNYSTMPQSFFIIQNFSSFDPIFNHINTKPSDYNIDGYDNANINALIKKHIQDNWDKSKPLSKNDLAIHYGLIPIPVSIQKLSDEKLTLPLNSVILFNSEFNDTTIEALLNNYLTQDLGDQLFTSKKTPMIVMQKNQMKNPEGYELTISTSQILIKAPTTAGVFYAIQTLRQLWNHNRALPNITIKDYPRFEYRGVLLDVARHYFPTNDIKKLIDLMAAQKLNTLHIHFSDDEAWRLWLENYPKLANVGSLRGFQMGSKLTPAVFTQANLDISNHQGFLPDGQLIETLYPQADTLYAQHAFYTWHDIQDLIEYANNRAITIIPEIDLPAHARALIYADPETFQNSQDKSQYISVQGYNDDVIPVCSYNQNGHFTNSMNEVIQDIATMFNHQTTLYAENEVSVGGDEVAADAWTQDPTCQDRLAWKDLSALDKSHYFFQLLSENLQNIKFSGWQQTFQEDDGSFSPHKIGATHTAHAWAWEPTGNGQNQAGIKNAAALANNGYPTVLAFADDTYFDLTYSPNQWEPGFSWAGSFLDTESALRSAYDANQTEQLIEPSMQANLKGLEGALWSENLTNFRHLMYMALPKMTGLAEAGWSPASKTTANNGAIDWQSLATRLGDGKSGFLYYLNKISSIEYRGYPDGINCDIPTKALSKNNLYI